MFHRAHMHDKNVSSLHEMKWTAEAMGLVANTKLSSDEKKRLVISLHSDLVKAEFNAFQGSFDIGGAIEFVWDTDHQRYGIRVKKKGIFEKCLPCCSEASCMVDVDDRQLYLDAEPITEEEEKKGIEGSQLFTPEDLGNGDARDEDKDVRDDVREPREAQQPQQPQNPTPDEKDP